MSAPTIWQATKEEITTRIARVKSLLDMPLISAIARRDFSFVSNLAAQETHGEPSPFNGLSDRQLHFFLHQFSLPVLENPVLFAFEHARQVDNVVTTSEQASPEEMVFLLGNQFAALNERRTIMGLDQVCLQTTALALATEKQSDSLLLCAFIRGLNENDRDVFLNTENQLSQTEMGLH